MLKVIRVLDNENYGFIPANAICCDNARNIYLDGDQLVDPIQSPRNSVFVKKQVSGYIIKLDSKYTYIPEDPARKFLNYIRVSSVMGRQDAKLDPNMLRDLPKRIKDIEVGNFWVDQNAICVTESRTAYLNIETQLCDKSHDNIEVKKNKSYLALALPKYMSCFSIMPSEEVEKDNKYMIIDNIIDYGHLVPLFMINKQDHDKIEENILTVESLEDGDSGYIDHRKTHLTENGYLAIESDAEVIDQETVTHGVKITKTKKFISIILDSSCSYSINNLIASHKTIYADSVNGNISGYVPSSFITPAYRDMIYTSHDQFGVIDINEISVQEIETSSNASEEEEKDRDKDLIYDGYERDFLSAQDASDYDNIEIELEPTYYAPPKINNSIILAPHVGKLPEPELEPSKPEDQKNQEKQEDQDPEDMKILKVVMKRAQNLGISIV